MFNVPSLNVTWISLAMCDRSIYYPVYVKPSKVSWCGISPAWNINGHHSLFIAFFVSFLVSWHLFCGVLGGGYNIRGGAALQKDLQESVLAYLTLNGGISVYIFSPITVRLTLTCFRTWGDPGQAHAASNFSSLHCVVLQQPFQCLTFWFRTWRQVQGQGGQTCTVFLQYCRQTYIPAGDMGAVLVNSTAGLKISYYKRAAFHLQRFTNCWSRSMNPAVKTCTSVHLINSIL